MSMAALIPALIPVLGASARMLTVPRASAFRAALADPRAAEERALRRITAGLARSRYGQRHGLHPNADYAGYAAALPIVTHADLAGDIERAAQGAPGVLWPGRIAHWETTSGSSGPKKRVPISETAKCNRIWFALLTQVLSGRQAVSGS